MIRTLVIEIARHLPILRQMVLKIEEIGKERDQLRKEMGQLRKEMGQLRKERDQLKLKWSSWKVVSGL
ncbi:hypothetical protein ACFL2Q_02270 [Thermodesulfobacteriota bacterium]